MPELPEVETVRRGLALKMTGRRIVRAGIAPPRSASAVSADAGRTARRRRIGALGRRGKYILIEIAEDGLLLLHLGMSGAGSDRRRRYPEARHDHVVLTLDDGTVVRFNDARRFGTLDYLLRSEINIHPLLAGMGRSRSKRRSTAAISPRRSPAR